MKKKMETTYSPNKEVSAREIERQILFLRPGDNFLYTLNETGRFIWQRILKKKTVPEIIKNFARQFHISDEQAKKDISKFIRELEKKNIILK